MTLPPSLLRELENPNLSVDSRAELRCNAAKVLEYKGEYEKARKLLSDYWTRLGDRPNVTGLDQTTAGEILLRAGKPADAAAQFHTALLRQPNRARSLLGLARAAAQSGDQSTATATYAKFLEQWKQADEGLAELREARDYIKSHPQITQKT